jgi:hypothetical protein
MGLKTGVEGDRPWRQIAGPPMSPEALRLATLPLDPKVEVSLKRANRFPPNADALFQRKTAPLNILGGYRFEAAPDLGSLLQRVTSTGVAVGARRDRGCSAAIAGY